jgi:hypothetical protein
VYCSRRLSTSRASKRTFLGVTQRRVDRHQLAIRKNVATDKSRTGGSWIGRTPGDAVHHFALIFIPREEEKDRQLVEYVVAYLRQFVRAEIFFGDAESFTSELSVLNSNVEERVSIRIGKG